jgi:hypothetical protein
MGGMSDRHMHITGFLRGIDGVEQFTEAARALQGVFFAEVIPVQSANGGVIAVAFYSKDLDGISDELDMPDVAERLSGILSHDIEIVSAWDGPLAEPTSFCRGYRERERVWLVGGRRPGGPLPVTAGQAAPAQNT